MLRDAPSLVAAVGPLLTQVIGKAKEEKGVPETSESGGYYQASQLPLSWMGGLQSGPMFLGSTRPTLAHDKFAIP
jgi:hypothetical protein